MTDPAKPAVDQTVPQERNNHGSKGAYSGQDAGSAGHPVPETVDAGAMRGGMPADRHPGAGAGQEATDLPADAGHRATIDPKTGAVHGSGAGAGGGGGGEDIDLRSPGGGGLKPSAGAGPN